MSKFSEWVERQGQDHAAKLLEVSQGMVSRLNSGHRRPSLALALRIARLTRGQVPVHFWRNDERKRKKS